MSVTLCTLFEGDYHLGTAALLNSLHRSGFTGTFVCGHRGPRPSWAERTASLSPLQVIWVEVSAPVHLTNYKPTFMLACLHTHTPAAESVGYLDPDIIVKAPWPVLDRWLRGGGVTLCEDVNAYLPAGHPYRFAWQDFFVRHRLVPVRALDRYYNAGFLALPRAQESFLRTWEHLIVLANQELGSLSRIKHGHPGSLFHTIDQDAMNMALLLQPVPIHAAGGEAMDFLPGGHLLSHATGGRKPWRGGFLREALRGRPPGLAQKQFYHHAESPLPVLSATTLAWRRFDLGLAALLGRIYRRT